MSTIQTFEWRKGSVIFKEDHIPIRQDKSLLFGR